MKVKRSGRGKFKMLLEHSPRDNPLSPLLLSFLSYVPEKHLTKTYSVMATVTYTAHKAV
jgi:hypothetical protein